MAVCPNCKAQLGCSCKLRKASNGAAVCTLCVAAYEEKLKILKANEKPATQ